MMKKKISWHNFLNFKNLKSIFLGLDLCRIVGGSQWTCGLFVWPLALILLMESTSDP